VIGAAVPCLRARFALWDAHSSKQHAGACSSGSTTTSVRRRSRVRNRYRPDVDEDRARIESYLRWREESTSTRVEPSRFGTALFNDDFPSYWDGNFLRVDGPVDATAEQLIVEANRLFEDVAHREIVVPDEVMGSRVAASFGREGWEIDRLVFMVQRRDPDRTPVVAVEECKFDEVYPLMLEANLASHGGMTPEAAETNAAVRRVFADVTGARFFAVRVDGAPAGFGELYEHDGVAEIDDVHTLERFRRRGIARAVVVHIVREARDAGADLVFLIADDADWPKQLYARLGFDPVGKFWQFTKPPEGESYR
jgi:ribosomal protein S18 acetylase RimI-like enzyme